MTLVLILFAFTLSLVINFIERLVNPVIDDETEEMETGEQLAFEPSENRN